MGETGEIDIKEQDRQIILKNQNLTEIVISKNSAKLVKQITTFNASNNQITQMLGIAPFINLIVLNLSHNNIGEIGGCNQLKNLSALILNNNKITKIKGLENCLEINTIVLSHNLLTEIDGIQHLNKLKKLSISHNQIEDLEKCKCPNLEELRINDNKIINIPPHFSEMQKLRILDIGKNQISKANQILVLQNLKLINLNVAGNPCCDKAVSLAVKFPRIRIVNNMAAEKVLETHKSKIPLKIQENTEKNKKKISQPVALYDLEQEIPAPVVQKPKKSVIVKIEKNNKTNKKLQKRVKQINLNHEPIIEKW